ncbi:amino acid permease [Cutibacterium avidum]|uniref:amino acid permease n=1 Tax=Cutibacterium avidum TaxID=33010 RepID=UPI0008F56657|nr:amino acid permease [Cutibacterium avidum]MCO6632140.1 amino acid permease [Cutibacterium avidum]MCO6660634.1 amino acid permease [Cutibacterium avidum]MCO6664807.1 amino acid permease [Cutibacterium avidum]MCT1415417.1 amino acid permease [Cutibacterium avidum]MCX8467320.1 amino acid permease [Cutibacterium avidum]
MATQMTGVTRTPTGPAGGKPRMKGRHLVMMSLGSAIGTGLFVGSGKGVAAAGPATLVAYIVAGLLVIAIMYMLGEMVAAHPDSGAFSVYTSRAMGPAAGFAMGWVWWIELVIVVAAEAIAAAATLVAMWPIAPVWLLTLVFLVALAAINLLGVDRFGEFEFWFALLKVAAVIVFLVIGVLLICGVLAAPAAGTSNLVGHGGFMPNGWSGVAAALLMVTFSFGGIEIMAVAAAETEDPARNVSRAVRTIVWRILLFYMGSVAVMVIAVPWDDPKLGTSPFVAVLDRAGIPAASEIMTLVVVLALLSSLNANLYGAARMLGSLAERGMAPRAAMRTGGRSVPAVAVLASVLFGFCCVLATFKWGDTVLDTLLNIVGSTIIVTYFFTICSQYVLRRRVEREGTPLPMRIKGFPVVSWVSMILLAGIVVLGMFAPDVRAQLLSTGALVVVLYLVGIAWSRHDGRSPFRPTTD